MIADLLFAILAAVVGLAAALMFYGAGLMSGYDKGKRHQQRMMRHFVNKSQEALAKQGLNTPHSHGRQGLN
jgi:hypothetical protein